MRDLRIDRAGVPLCERLTFEANGDRVVVVGPAAAGIVAVLSHQALLVHGRINIDGHDVISGHHRGRLGIALCDQALPPRLSVKGYVSLSLRTAGCNHRTAKHEAANNLERLGLAKLGTRRTESLNRVERRAVGIAGAMLPTGNIIVVETPLSGLEGPEQYQMLTVVGQLSQHRKVIATAERSDAGASERDLIAGATHVVIVDRHAALWSGPPDQLAQGSPWMALAVRGDADAFVEALQKSGFEIQGRPPRLTVRCSKDRATDLLSLAEASNATLIELLPLITAPAAPSAPEKDPAP